METVWTMTDFEMRHAISRVKAARDDVMTCLRAPELFPKAAAEVAVFRAACEALDLEQQLRDGRRLRPEQALDLAIHTPPGDVRESR